VRLLCWKCTRKAASRDCLAVITNSNRLFVRRNACLRVIRTRRRGEKGEIERSSAICPFSCFPASFQLPPVLIWVLSLRASQSLSLVELSLTARCSSALLVSQLPCFCPFSAASASSHRSSQQGFSCNPRANALSSGFASCLRRQKPMNSFQLGRSPG